MSLDLMPTVGHPAIALDDPHHGSASGGEPTPIGGGAKRVFDIAVALLFVVAFAPLLAGVALLMKVTDRGPIFYGHSRVGHGGRMFRCWKFRTMVVDGDTLLDRYFLTHPQERMVWEEKRKLERDPRVTPLGAVLRRTSLDELPQIWNVLKGEMSIVGPRPIVPEELLRYGRSRVHYLKARPGVTGLWQASGRSSTDYGRRVMLDRFYVSRWSVLLDVWIILKTVPAVLGRKGAC